MQLNVACPMMTMLPATLQDAWVNGSFTQALSMTGGSAPYTWAMTSGALPVGLSFSTSTQTIGGTPQTTGSSTFTIEATDKFGCKISRVFTVTVKSVGIGNLVWDDRNNNGLRDGVEPGLANVAVTLYRDDGNNTRDGLDVQVATQTTTSVGAYAFTNMPPGTYYVKVVPPTTHAITSGSSVSLDNNVDGDNNGLQPGGLNGALFSPMIVLTHAAEPSTDGDSDINTDWTVDFGLWTGIDIGDLVWSDDDNNGTRNGAEAGVGNVTLELLSPGV